MSHKLYPRDAEFLNQLNKVPTTGRHRWKNGKQDRIYEWDSQEGELEVYNRLGIHLGTVDPYTGMTRKPAKKGREIDV